MKKEKELINQMKKDLEKIKKKIEILEERVKRSVTRASLEDDELILND